MKTIYKISLFFALIMSTIVIAQAPPQILTYHNGYWFNDKNEEINPAIIDRYEVLSYDPWIINVNSPTLKYSSEKEYNDGEIIQITKDGNTTTLIADSTITLTITPKITSGN